MTFPLSKQEWYLKRDDRTRRVNEIKGFEDFKVGIIVSDEIANDFQIQVMTWIMGNILARWCRHITLQIPEDTVSKLNLSKGKNFKNSIKNALFQVDPYLTLEFDNVDEDKANAVCIIGNQTEQLPKGNIWIDCDGWLSGIGIYPRRESPTRIGSKNILGASFSACLGCSELFRRAIGKESMQEEEQWYSLWDFKKSLSKNELKNASYIDNWGFGHVQQPGCGAVGSSFDYLLALTNWSGSIDLVDSDVVDYSNCNRALAFTPYQAADRTIKADVCLDVLKTNPKINCRKFACSYSEYIKQGNFFRPTPDLILCLANQGTIWPDIQYNLPPLVLHATTTPNWGVNFGRHIPKKEWCILCRFSEEAKRLHQFIPECGKGTVVEKNDTMPILGALPFLSPMSAILLLVEMAKMGFSSYPVNSNFVDFSFKASMGAFLASIGEIKENCICRSQKIETYLDAIRKTKYWHLVN